MIDNWRGLRIYLVNLFLFTSLVLAQTNDSQHCSKATEAGYWQGLDGWIFSASDLRIDIPVAEHYVKRLGEAFRDKGITVVLVVIPPRGISSYKYMDITREPFASYNLAEATQTYEDLLQIFREAGFIAPNLLEDYPEDTPFFLKNDHHWSPEAANHAAEEVDKALSELKLSYEETYKTHLEPAQLSRKGSYATRVNELCGASLIAETYNHYVTTPVEDMSLLEERASPEIVLIGTSNSLDDVETFNANFSGFLAEKLSASILNMSIAGGGAFRTLENYLISDSFLTSNPKVIIWETLLSAADLSNVQLDNAQIYRQIIPSIYQDCLVSPLLETHLTKEALRESEKVIQTLDTIELKKAIIENDTLLLPEGKSTAKKIKLGGKNATVTFRYNTELLGGETLGVSLWLWTTSELPVEAQLSLVSLPNRTDDASLSITLTKEPQQFTLSKSLQLETADTSLNIKLTRFSNDNTSIFVWNPRISNLQSELIVNNENLPIGGPDYYLILSSSDFSLVNFNILIEYQNGASEVFPVRRDRRVQNTGEFFVEFSDHITSYVANLSLVLPLGIEGEITARVCKIE